MIIPIFTLFILSSIVWLFISINGRKEIGLFILNLYWWLGSIVPAYFAWLTWQDRGYSENWAMIGFMMFSLPYLVITGVMIVAELIFIRKWQGGKTKTIKMTALSLLIFLVFQMVVGLLSA